MDETAFNTEIIKLTKAKLVKETDVYDEHYTGFAILCIPLGEIVEGEDLSMLELPVPQYYFNKMLKEDKITISHDRKHFIGDFGYSKSLGAIFH